MKQKILILLLCSFISSATMSVGVQAADACEILDVSVEEQNSTEAFSQNDWEVRLSDEEILERYNLFLQRKSSMLSEEKTDAQSLLEEFADYAVDNKIIEDTPEARAAITKAVVRAEFKVVVTAGNVLGYTMSATLLEHSLQDNPGILSYGASTDFANNIGASNECLSIINSFKQAVNGTNKTSYSMNGTITLNSTTDLHLAFINVNYSAMGTKLNGVWSVYITFTDTYDFDYVAWKNEMTDNDAVTVLNNYAAYAQSIGAIVPYTIHVTVLASG